MVSHQRYASQQHGRQRVAAAALVTLKQQYTIKRCCCRMLLPGCTFSLTPQLQRSANQAEEERIGEGRQAGKVC